MNDRDIVELLSDWPQPESGAPEPRIHASEGSLSVVYITAEETYAVVEFPMCHQFTFGHPNDETLHGHPLFSRGLKFYSVHRIRNSSRLDSLAKANAVHPRHNPAAYLANKEHFVFTFHDSTLECLVTTGERGHPKVSTFATAEEASIALRHNAA